MPPLSVNGAELAFTEYGSGARVIVSAQQHFASEGYVELLAQPPMNCHVFAIRLRQLRKQDELPGEDQNPRWFARWSDDVYRATQMLGLDNFVYTGVSHGRVIGWHLAVEHPDLLRGLVSIVGVPPPRSRRTGALSGRASQMAARQDPASLRANTERLFGPPRDAVPLARRGALVQERIERVVSTAPDEARVKLGIGFPDVETDEELRKLLGQVHVPTLIIGGMHDPWVTPENVLDTARSVPAAKWSFSKTRATWSRWRVQPESLRSSACSWTASTKRHQLTTTSVPSSFQANSVFSPASAVMAAM